jgi:SAM-dependent methyltransferase
MGLDFNTAQFLLGEKARGVSLGRTLTLGRQGVYMTTSEYSGLLSRLGATLENPGHGDDFFKALGAQPLMAMDASSYEGADLIHDLNHPIGLKLHSTFDTLIDGGALEHIFNFPVSIRNCMQMVKPGGRFIMITPWHNYAGHGFYQFSPELLHSVLSEDNGYKVERMLIAAEGNWYNVRKPAELKHRIEITTNDKILLCITALRVDDKPIFTKWPQQSDYTSAWQKTGSYNESDIGPRLTLAQRISLIFPAFEFLRCALRERRARLANNPSCNPGLARICASTEIPITN